MQDRTPEEQLEAGKAQQVTNQFLKFVSISKRKPTHVSLIEDFWSIVGPYSVEDISRAVEHTQPGDNMGAIFRRLGIPRRAVALRAFWDVMREISEGPFHSTGDNVARTFRYIIEEALPLTARAALTSVKERFVRAYLSTLGNLAEDEQDAVPEQLFYTEHPPLPQWLAELTFEAWRKIYENGGKQESTDASATCN